MYSHSLAGMAACYVAALPFYRNDLISTGLVAGALFGLPALAHRLAHRPHAQQSAA
jgi:NO-binding membrane sensor protein with MHYT domain